MNLYSCSLVPQLNLPDHGLANTVLKGAAFSQFREEREEGIPVSKHQLCCNWGNEAED